MINAAIYYKSPSGDEEGFAHIKGYIVQGHAQMAETGYDLVCASVSVLAQTALLGLDKYLSLKPQWRIEDDGYMECWLPDKLSDEEQNFANVILDTMRLGLCSIEKEYGQYLKVCKRRWNKCCSE